MRTQTDTARAGFTLVELLIVIVIVGLLSAIAIPAINYARESARRTACLSRIRQCGEAMAMHEAAKRRLPGSRSQHASGFRYAWPVEVLAYLDRLDLHDAINVREQIGIDPRTGKPIFGPTFDPNAAAAENPPSETNPFQPIEQVRCPSDKSSSPIRKLSYVVNGGRLNYQNAAADGYPPNLPGNTPALNHDWRENGLFDDTGASRNSAAYSPRKRSRVSVLANEDGAANTLMLTENIDAEWWYTANREWDAAVLWFPTLSPAAYAIPGFGGRASPLNRDTDPESWVINTPGKARPSSQHTGGFNVLFADGAARFVSDKIEYRIYCLLMTSNGSQSRNPADQAGAPLPPWQTDKLVAGDFNF